MSVTAARFAVLLLPAVAFAELSCVQYPPQLATEYRIECDSPSGAGECLVTTDYSPPGDDYCQADGTGRGFLRNTAANIYRFTPEDINFNTVVIWDNLNDAADALRVCQNVLQAKLESDECINTDCFALTQTFTAWEAPSECNPAPSAQAASGMSGMSKSGCSGKSGSDGVFTSLEEAFQSFLGLLLAPNFCSCDVVHDIDITKTWNDVMSRWDYTTVVTYQQGAPVQLGNIMAAATAALGPLPVSICGCDRYFTLTGVDYDYVEPALVPAASSGMGMSMGSASRSMGMSMSDSAPSPVVMVCPIAAYVPPPAPITAALLGGSATASSAVAVAAIATVVVAVAAIVAVRSRVIRRVGGGTEDVETPAVVVANPAYEEAEPAEI